MVRNHPEIARAMVDAHRRYRNVTDKLSLATDDRNFQGDGGGAASRALTMPHEEVRDYFYTRQNYIDSVDLAAERLATELGTTDDNQDVEEVLARRLTERHGVKIRTRSDMGDTQHHFDPTTGELDLARGLSPGQRAFRMATELLSAVPDPREPGRHFTSTIPGAGCAAWPRTCGRVDLLVR